jgi:hypothetical protein
VKSFPYLPLLVCFFLLFAVQQNLNAELYDDLFYSLDDLSFSKYEAYDIVSFVLFQHRWDKSG